MRRSFWKGVERVALRFACEFIAVQGDDEEIPDVFPDGFTIGAPKRRHSIQDECQSIHPKLPKLLILILITFLEGDGFGELRQVVM